MPTRPLKEGSVTTYQAKVAAGFPDILASEMDADLDTIYAAWNGGIGTANLGDGSVTYAKLAPDAQLWRDTGTALTPGTSFATRQLTVPGNTTNGAAAILGPITAKLRLQAHNTIAGGGLFENRDFVAGNAQDDATKPSWGAVLRSDLDQFLVQRSPAGSTTQSSLLALDPAALTLQPSTATGWMECRAYGYATVAGIFKGYQSRGAVGAPTATLNTDAIAVLSGNGCYQAGSYSEQALLRFVAVENWSATARGTQLIVSTTQNGQATLNNTLTFDYNGNFIISGTIGQKASGTTWANPSDRRLKEEITDYATGLAAILQLQPRTFLYNGKGGSIAGMRGYGFVADEMAPIMPETVSVRAGKLEPNDEDETEIQTLDQSNLILALVNAARELAGRVAALEASR